ncbi:DUF2069 domain-containing protein [Tahibacter harae]|uniref:DUF2069 domain-containing protein n=1 Tax=Tahibacter harae TaxID=2963937 RepID=A0ABT1QQG9_9GAMM|nr:DUF2069 domain-containing protein [Tahibacter harae]MCQ4164514.1 DUF2069 domain-containing protein [Tahibacter harae]
MNPRKLALAAWAGLILLHLAWHGWLAPPQNGSSGLAIALTAGPLLLPLLALRRSLARALLWVGILGLFYFCHGVIAAWGEPRARGPALVEIVLCLVLIGALGWSARGYRRKPRH